MPYQGCHIVQFGSATNDTLREAFRMCEAKAKEKIELAGEQVAVFTEKLEEDMWSFVVTQPRPGILICATDKAFLAETLMRIGQETENRALPLDLPEWKHVDVKARVWAVRHYRKASAEKDLSSPLGPEAAANVPDSAAVGFVFWFNPDRDDVARARYLGHAVYG